MKELKCPNCGGPVKHKGWGKYYCEYCGTEFENKDEYGVIHIVKEQSDTVTLAAKAIVDEHMFRCYSLMGEDKDKMYAHIKESLCDQLAHGLVQYLNLRENYDPMHMNMSFIGTVDVVDPVSRRYSY